MTEPPSSSPPPAMPAAVSAAYDFLLWLINHVGKFPRSHRFVLGERIETAMLNVVMALVEAAYVGGPQKTPLLKQPSRELEKVRILVRLGAST